MSIPWYQVNGKRVSREVWLAHIIVDGGNYPAWWVKKFFPEITPAIPSPPAVREVTP